MPVERVRASGITPLGEKVEQAVAKLETKGTITGSVRLDDEILIFWTAAPRVNIGRETRA